MGVSKPVFTSIRTKAVDNAQRWVNRGTDIEKQMTMKDYYFHFCLLQPWTRNQSECTNISHSQARFLAERNLRSKLSDLYGDLQTILRFHRKKYTVNIQLQSHVEDHSDLRTLRK